jgi:hypothetical protein
VFPHNCRVPNDLTNINIAAASNSSFDSGPRDPTFESEPDEQPEEPLEEPRVIGDFDGSSNALWTLFRDEAKSHDDAQINTLKEDMESALIFVRSYPICTYSTMDSVVLMRVLTGWFIFCCPHCIRT